jgi:hypothetical protein
MASSIGDDATRTWAQQKADALTSHFDHDWWFQSQGLFADSLALPNAVPTDPKATLGLPNQTFTQLEQLFWINATPMETSIALPARAAAALPVLESSSFTGTGFYQQAKPGGLPRRIARERVPTIAVLTQHGAAQNHTTADKGDRSRNGFPRIRNRRGAFTAV